MIYRPKKFWWGPVVFAMPSVVGLVLIYAVIMPSPKPESARVSLMLYGAGLILIAVGAITLWAYLSASYEITSEELVVRLGPIRLRYRLSSIAKAIPTLVPLGAALSFATSWDMVYITFRNPGGRLSGWPLAISPADKTAFLRELAERVPGLRGQSQVTQEDSQRLEP